MWVITSAISSFVSPLCKPDRRWTASASEVVMEPNYGSQITYVRVNNSLRLIVEEVMPYFVIVPQTVRELMYCEYLQVNHY